MLRNSFRAPLCFIGLVLCFLLCTAHTTNAKELLTFEGQLDLVNNNLDVLLTFDEKSSIKANVRQNSSEDYHFLMKIEHLALPMFNISSEVESDFHLEHWSNEKKDVKGKIWSQYSLVDYQPISELSGSYQIKEDILKLQNLSFGRLGLNGSIGLQYPYKLDLVFNLDSIDMDDFLDFWMSERSYSSEGPVSGNIKVSGALDHLLLKGKLQSSNGFVKNLHFDSIHLNVEGTYPKVQVVHSTLSETDGMSYTLNGPINLEDQANFKKQIKALSITPLVRESDSELEWTIKSVGEEQTGKTELKYLLRKGGAGQDSDEETAMFGIERSMEF